MFEQITDKEIEEIAEDQDYDVLYFGEQLLPASILVCANIIYLKFPLFFSSSTLRL